MRIRCQRGSSTGPKSGPFPVPAIRRAEAHPTKRKTASDLSPDFWDQSDAARPGLGWGMASGYMVYNSCRIIPGQVRVLFFPARNARQLPLPKPPGKNLIEAVHKKPLCSNQQRKRTSKTNYKHRLPQARCLRPTHSSSPGLLQQRAGLKVYFRQFSPKNSNRVTTHGTPEDVVYSVT